MKSILEKPRDLFISDRLEVRSTNFAELKINQNRTTCFIPAGNDTAHIASIFNETSSKKRYIFVLKFHLQSTTKKKYSVTNHVYFTDFNVKS